MATNKVIIIGAGLGGLTAAVRLAASNINVEVYEKNDFVGGKTSYISSQGYRFDTSPDFFTLPFIFENCFSYSRRSIKDYLTLIELESIGKHFFSDKTAFNCYTDYIKRKREVENVFPENYVLFEKYSQLLDKNFDTALEHFFNKSVKGSGIFNFMSKLLDLNKLNLFNTCNDISKKFFRDPRLIQFFDFFANATCSSPYLAPSAALLYGHSQLKFGSYYVKGGYWKIADALKKIAEEYGVQFYFNEPIKKILVKKHKVYGVQLQSGKNVLCDAIISNTDVKHLYTDLISKKDLGRCASKKISKLEPSSSYFIMCLGVNFNSKKLSYNNIFYSKDTKKEFYEIHQQKMLPTDPTVQLIISSKIDSTAAPIGKENWLVIVNVPHLADTSNWQNKKNEFRNKIITKLRQYIYVSIDDLIEAEHIITPNDFLLRYNSSQGSIRGFSSNSIKQFFFRPKNKSNYFKNLYHASSGSHPGGGLAFAMLSGKHACDSALFDLKEK